MAVIEVYTDGGCSPNPGNGGWAVVLVKNGELVGEFYGGERETSNNRMELTAAIKGLGAIATDESIQLFTDSNYVKQGITTWIKGWKANGWKTAGRQPVKNQDLWQELDSVAATKKVEWSWLKGHAGNVWNERVDGLVHKARASLG